MTIDFDDAAAWAETMLRDTRLDGSDRVNVKLVARRCGVDLIASPRHMIVGARHEQVAKVGDHYALRFAKGLHVSTETFVIGHGLGHVAIAEYGIELDEHAVEPWCDAFAGALRLPRAVLCDAWRGDLRALVSTWPEISPTSVVLRLGETGLAPSFVTQGRAVRYARGEADPSAVIATGLEAWRTGDVRRADVAACRLERAQRAGVVLLAV